jgi:hypothetical protein
MIVNYDCKVRSKLWCKLRLALSIIAKARIINYDSRIIIYSFKVLATIIMIINCDRIVITIVNYDHKTFIVQATGLIGIILTEGREK